jgi:uncharacterized RDD family membrane protein YckC
MANAAPYIAQPMRRVVAGAFDLLVCICFVFFVWGVTTRVSFAPQYTGVALHNPLVFIVYAVYHAVMLRLFHGTTPGLYFLDMRIVRAADGADLSIPQVLGRAASRPAFLYCFWWLATLAAWAEIDFVFLVAPVFLELFMMFYSPTRQTLADVVSRTLVVNVPPPQPHRAPAAPMYSRSDAEFGVRSGRTK